MKNLKIFSIIFILLSLTMLINLVNASDTLLDSVPFTEYTTYWSMDSPIGTAGLSVVGQSLTNCALDKNITSIKFYLQKSNSPTVNLSVCITGLIGTVGTDAFYNGTILAISESISASTLTTSFALYEFLFPKGCLITANMNYGIFVIGTFGVISASHLVQVGMNNTVSTHYGNRFIYQSAIWVSNTKDLIFYIYGKTPTYDYDVGWTDGNSTGYNNGWTNGNSTGYNNGWINGNSTGYNNGWINGNATGYNSGNFTGFFNGWVYGNSVSSVTINNSGADSSLIIMMIFLIINILLCIKRVPILGFIFGFLSIALTGGMFLSDITINPILSSILIVVAFACLLINGLESRKK